MKVNQKVIIKNTGEWGIIKLIEFDEIHVAMFDDSKEVRLFYKEELKKDK